MSRHWLRGLWILVFSVSIISECYAWCDPPDIVIWDWRKYPCKGQSVGIRADAESGAPIYVWDWDFPGGLNYSYGYEDEYQSNVSVWSSSAGTYYVDAWGYNYCEWDYDWAVVYVVEVASVSASKTSACVGEAVTFTANSNPSSKTLSCIEWQKRYRPNSSSSWGSWGSASGGDNTAILSTTTPGLYQYRARNGSADTWKESSEVTVVEVKDVTFDPKVLRADGSFTSTASATIIPSGRSLTWSIQGVYQGCTINSSTGVITAGTGTGTITVRAADSALSTCYAEAQIKVVKLQQLTVSGADFFAGTSPEIYTTAQQAGANVTITAVLTPSVNVADLPANFVTWTNGTAGANQLERLVSRGTANTDVTVTANCAVSKSVRIYVRRVDPSNLTVTPSENCPTQGGGYSCLPNDPTTTWHVASVVNSWYVRVDTLECTGIIKNSGWPSDPNKMIVPNTANPVDGGNINNTVGSSNRWSYAKSDMEDYDTVGGGGGPDWHATSASQAHEQYHWDTDWMTLSIKGATGGNWSATETSLEGYNVSVFTYLTEAEAKTALTTQFDTRFTQFKNDAWTRWNAECDSPGLGCGAYGAGQSVLNGYIANVESYRISKGWAP